MEEVDDDFGAFLSDPKHSHKCNGLESREMVKKQNEYAD